MANYNSEYTGQQVDEAVGAVAMMSGRMESIEAELDTKASAEALSALAIEVSKRAEKSQATGWLEYDEVPSVIIYDTQQISAELSVRIGEMAIRSADNEGPILSMYNGTSWVVVGHPKNGLIYYCKKDGRFYTYSQESLTFSPVSMGNFISNDWNDSSRQHAPSARQMNLMYNNLILAYNSLVTLVDELANSSFKTARPTIAELDWVGSSSSFTIGYILSYCTKSQSSPTSVAEGDSFSATIIPDPGYTLNGVQASGSGFTQTYDSIYDRINISVSNVQSGMTITCVAVTYQVNVNYYLTGFASESNVTIQSGGSFTKVLSPYTGYSVKTIVITMGGVELSKSQVWDANTNTITIPVVTGDIVVTATAEETTDHTVSYNLDNVNKVSGAVTVEDGGTLTAILRKGDDFDGYYNDGTTAKGFSVRDIIVYMGGDLLVKGTDYTASQTSLNEDITINIPSITNDVVIMNVRWLIGTITASSGAVASSSRSKYTVPYIPIPNNCNTIKIRHLYVSSGSWGVAFYDNSNAYISGKSFNANTDNEINVPAGAKNFRFCVYDYYYTDHPSLNGAFVKDLTNNDYIWKGDDIQ